jgi:hypothetical protein
MSFIQASSADISHSEGEVQLRALPNLQSALAAIVHQQSTQIARQQNVEKSAGEVTASNSNGEPKKVQPTPQRLLSAGELTEVAEEPTPSERGPTASVSRPTVGRRHPTLGQVVSTSDEKPIRRRASPHGIPTTTFPFQALMIIFLHSFAWISRNEW